MKLSAETTAEQQAATAHPLKYSVCRATHTAWPLQKPPVGQPQSSPKGDLRTHAPSSGDVPCTSGLHAGAKSSLQGEGVKDV